MQMLAGSPVASLRLGYALSCRPWTLAVKMLRLVQECAGTVYIADFKLAERNLEAPAVLLLRFFVRLGAAAANRAYLLEYIQRGGLEGLLYEAGIQNFVRCRTLLAGGATLGYITTNVARSSVVCEKKQA